MYKKGKFLTLRTITPLHVGTGEGVGIIDLPIQREKHTQIPKVEGSSLKGALREAFEAVTQQNDEEAINVHRIFGIDEDTPGFKEKKEEIRSRLGFKKDDPLSISGCVAISDAFPVLFPVRSAKNVFALVTSPLIMSRLFMLMQAVEPNNKYASEIESLSMLADSFEENKLQAFVIDGTKLIVKDNKIVLEDLTFEADNSYSGALEKLSKFVEENFVVDKYLKNKILYDIVLIPDDIFKNFVLQGTEVITRTKIDNKTGTVSKTALWTEEYLPTETLLISGVFISNEFSKSENKLSAEDVESILTQIIDGRLLNTFQLGGNSTIGKGILKLKIN